MLLEVLLSEMAELASGSQNCNAYIYEITVKKLFVSEGLTVRQ